MQHCSLQQCCVSGVQGDLEVVVHKLFVFSAGMSRDGLLQHCSLQQCCVRGVRSKLKVAVRELFVSSAEMPRDALCSTALCSSAVFRSACGGLEVVGARYRTLPGGA